MLRLLYPSPSRVLSSLTLACALTAIPALAQDAPAPAAPAATPPAATQPAADTAPAADNTPAAAAPAPAPAPADTTLAPAPAPAEASPEEKQLRNDIDAYFHYAWIGRYDIASQFAQKITDEAADPAALIPILEDTAKLHDKNLGFMAQILLFDSQPELKDTTDKLLLKVQAGNVARAQDPALIEKMLRDMSAGERAYENNLPYLRRSGEMAVPVMMQFLRLADDDHKPYRPTVRRAMVDIGRSAVNPLMAALDMKNDDDTVLAIIDTLGSIGYDVAAPALARLADDQSQPQGIRAAATSALGRLSIAPSQAADPAGLYYQLATRFYYGTTDIAQTINNPGASADAPVQTRNYWIWDESKGLQRTEVPAAIFNDLMALRSCEQSLKLQAVNPACVSLWLDADNKREADLPDGATDPIRGDEPPAHYFNVSCGASHINDALARALKDRNAAVSLKLTRSLGLIVGRDSLNAQVATSLTDALRFPDKRVRFEGALALAAALPSKPFNGQEWVVPLLTEAVGEGAGGNVIVLGANIDDANALAGQLKILGYVTAVAGSPGDAVTAAATLPSVDAIVIARGAIDADVLRMISLSRQTPHLSDAVEVVMKDSSTGTVAALTLDNPQVSITTQTDGDGLKKDIEAARTKTGLAPLDPKEADAYASRAASALERLAVSGNTILNTGAGEAGLLSALDGSRPELIGAVGNVLARLPSATAQQGLAQHALNDQTPAEVRVSLFQSLTHSAKEYGNRLEGPQVKLLEDEAVQIKDPDLRSAAAEARGALNLPTDQARDLILSQTGN